MLIACLKCLTSLAKINRPLQNSRSIDFHVIICDIVVFNNPRRSNSNIYPVTNKASDKERRSPY
jgi:hypothetical protein